MRYGFYIIFIVGLSLSNQFNQDDLKQAKVVEFISTKTINYIENLKDAGDNKYYHFHKQLDAYFERARARVSLNNIEGAHSDIDQILSRDSEYWDAYYYKGKLFMMAGDYASALPYLSIAVENGMDLNDLFLLRGIAKFEEGWGDRGLADFEKLLDRNTLSRLDKFTILFYYSKISFISGDLDKALQSAMDAYEINSHDIELLKHRGNIYRLLDMPELAIKDFNKALSLGYNNRDLYFYRGLSYIQLNNHSNAESDLAKYLSLSGNLDYNRPQTLLEFSIVKFYLGDKDEALINLNEVIKLIPSETSAYAYRGVIHYQNKSYQDAINDFDIGIKSGLFGNELYLYRGNSKFYLEEYKAALEDINIYLSRNPKGEDNLYDAYINRSIIFYTLEYYDDALKDISKALEIKSDDGEAYVHRANIYRYLDRINECMNDLNKALELGEDHIDIYLSRGLINVYNQNYELAEKDLDIFLNNNQNIHRDELLAILKRGISRFNLKKFNLAMDDFNELLLRDSSIIEAYRYRAEIYLMNGKKQLAKKDLEQALLSEETIPEIYLLKGMTELSLNNFNIAILDLNQFINLSSTGDPYYFHAFHERGLAEFFIEDSIDACIDWNYAAENGYSKSIKFIRKNCNIYSEVPE